jgi:hypothetical protein
MLQTLAMMIKRKGDLIDFAAPFEIEGPFYFFMMKQEANHCFQFTKSNSRYRFYL